MGSKIEKNRAVLDMSDECIELGYLSGILLLCEIRETRRYWMAFHEPAWANL